MVIWDTADVFCIIYNQDFMLSRGGGGQVVSRLTYYSDNPSSIPAESVSIFLMCKIAWNKRKEVANGHLKITKVCLQIAPPRFVDFEVSVSESNHLPTPFTLSLSSIKVNVPRCNNMLVNEWSTTELVLWHHWSSFGSMTFLLETCDIQLITSNMMRMQRFLWRGPARLEVCLWEEIFRHLKKMATSSFS